MFRLTSALMILCSTACLGTSARAIVVQTPAPAPAPKEPAAPSADPAFDAASDLKKKAAYAEAAAAFEAYAKEHATEPRAAEALNEAGVCWYSVGRSKMKNLRNTTESRKLFEKSLDLFGKVVESGSKDQGGRAQYMRGWVKFTMDDPEGALAEFDNVFDKWKDDAKYVPKALERHAMVRRSLLQTSAAMSDLQRYVKQYPQGDDIEAVQRYLAYCRDFEKPAPAIHPEAWIQGEPTTLQALRGDVVVVYFFATWCPHCEEVRPAMIDLYDHYGPIGVHVIGVVDHTQGQTVDSVKAILPVKGYQFPVVMDSGAAFGAFHGSKIPDVVLIDRAGRVRWHDNPNNLHDSSIEALLLEDPPAAGAKPQK
jgi:thiol-disulfide isomerase/thioredoxin